MPTQTVLNALQIAQIAHQITLAMLAATTPIFIKVLV